MKFCRVETTVIRRCDSILSLSFSSRRSKNYLRALLTSETRAVELYGRKPSFHYLFSAYNFITDVMCGCLFVFMDFCVSVYVCACVYTEGFCVNIVCKYFVAKIMQTYFPNYVIVK